MHQRQNPLGFLYTLIVFSEDCKILSSSLRTFARRCPPSQVERRSQPSRGGAQLYAGSSPYLGPPAKLQIDPSSHTAYTGHGFESRPMRWVKVSVPVSQHIYNTVRSGRCNRLTTDSLTMKLTGYGKSKRCRRIQDYFNKLTTWNRRPLPSMPFPIRYSLIIPSSDEILSELLTASLNNKPQTKPATGTYSEPHKFSPHPYTLRLFQGFILAGTV
jgi:hypothetical protein